MRVGFFFLCNFDQSSQVFISDHVSSYSFAPLTFFYIYICVCMCIYIYVCILERGGKKCIVEKNLLQEKSLIFWKCTGGNFKLMMSYSFFSVESRLRLILALLK